MKTKFAVIISFLILLQMSVTARAANGTAENNEIAVVSAYCMENTLYSFVKATDYDIEEMRAQTEIIGGETALPDLMKDSNAAVTYVLLIDNSGSMKNYISEVKAYADELIERERHDAEFIIITFGEQVFFNEAVNTENCLDKSSVKNVVSSAIDQMDFSEKWTDPYVGITSVVKYLDEDYPGKRGGLVNLVLLTDGVPDLQDKEREQEKSEMAGKAVASSPEMVLHTVFFQEWSSEYEKPQGTGIDIVIDEDLDAAAAAERTVAYIDSLYKIDFQLDKQLSGRIEFMYYLAPQNNKTDETIELIPLVAKNVPVMTEDNGVWHGPFEDDSPKEENNFFGHTEEEGTEFQEEILIEDRTDSEKEEIQSGSFGDGILAGIFIMLCLMAVTIITAVTVMSARRRKSKQNHGLSGQDVLMRLDMISGRCSSKRKVFYLKEQLIIGSDSKCDIVIRNSEVSPQNTRIFMKEQMICIEDLDSVCGTVLGGMRIYAANRLRSGDEISIGSTRFCFRF